jgi:hypothetical protein
LIVNFVNYYLASNFSRKNHSGGGVQIYIRSDLQINAIDISQFCIQKIFEASAVQIITSNYFIIIICIYGSPSRNFCTFLSQLGVTLTYLHKSRIEFVGILM